MLKETDDFYERLQSYHKPPSGGSIELDRLDFYTKRAAPYQDLKWDENFKQLYVENLKQIFSEEVQPIKRNLKDYFHREGNIIILRRAVFDWAERRVKTSSTPGYPLAYEFAVNGEVDSEMLYRLVCYQFNLWFGAEICSALNSEPLDLFEIGYTNLNTIFVKSEYTKIDKIARLICGSDLVKLIISQVLFGEMIAEVPENYGKDSNQIGLDFNTDVGIRNFFSNIEPLFQVAEKFGVRVVGSDIQGNEYVTKDFQIESWYTNYAEIATDDPELKHLYRAFMVAELKSLDATTHGVLYQRPYVNLNTGILLTHKINCNNRAALSRSINIEYVREVFPAVSKAYEETIKTKIPDITNGDDCGEVTFMDNKEFIDRYARRGFKVTDVQENTRTRVAFSSQLFLRHTDGSVSRRPESILKSVLNIISDPCNEESVTGVLMHCAQHPGFHHLKELAIASSKVFQSGESFELTK